MTFHPGFSPWRVATLAGAALLVAQAASAATFNFMDIADGATFNARLADGSVVSRTGAEGNWNEADSAGNPAIVGPGAGILDDGITVYATGSSIDGAAADAFLDSRNAGLGVCSSLPVGCKSGVPGANTADDNLNRAEESLTLRFSEMVRIAGLTIRDATHNPANGDFDIDGTTYSVIDGVVDTAALTLLSSGTAFTLAYLETGTEIYIESITVAPVPLPAAAGLLAAAMAGLGFAARRRARA